MKKKISFAVILTLLLVILVGVTSVSAKHALCVDFYEYEDNLATSISDQADRVCGSEWWDGKAGQYWVVFVSEFGPPELEGDLVGDTWDR